MMSIKKEYQKYKEERAKICKKIVKLEQKPDVAKYRQLKLMNRKLKEHEDLLYKQMMFEEYDNCDHVLIYTTEDTEKRSGRIYKYCGCIKCGLDESIKIPKDTKLKLTQQTQLDYLRTHDLKGTQIEIDCDIDTACEICKGILKENKNIDDKALISLFKLTFTHILGYNTSENDINKIKVKGSNE